MKKLFLLASVALMAVACTLTNDGYTLENLTTEDVVYNSGAEKPWTFGASCKWESTAFAGKMGVFYHSKPNVSKDNYTYTAYEYFLNNGNNQHSNSVNLTSMIGGFKSGDTCYYRAYVQITGTEGSTYTYGEEKSFTVQ